MTDFLSAGWRAFRYTVATVGGVLSAAFIAYGVLLRISEKETGAVDNIILGFGVFMAIMSCTICGMASLGDRQVRLMVQSMEVERLRLQVTVSTLQEKVDKLDTLNTAYGEANEEHRRLIRDAEERYKARSKELKEHATALAAQVDGLSGQTAQMAQENRELHNQVDALAKLNSDYTSALADVRAAHEASKAEIEQLRLLSGESSLKLKQLTDLSDEQRNRIDELTKQAANLTELQRKSVQMIQMLSLYGDECKTLGTSLSDISGQLHKTDLTLGLTAGEMSAQLAALKIITTELRNVAAERGIHEDFD